MAAILPHALKNCYPSLFLLSILFSSFHATHGQPFAPSAACSPPVVLKVCVPLKQAFTEFVSFAGTPLNATFRGLSVEVFEHAVRYLNAAEQPSCERLTYEYVPVGDGNYNPPYDELIENKECDAIVGDVTITSERMQKVDFTQPYAKSALVVVVPVEHEPAWDLFRPFYIATLQVLGIAIFPPFTMELTNNTLLMKFLLGITLHMRFLFLTISLYTVIMVLRYIFTSSSIFFFSQREGTRSNLERCLTMLCILLIVSNYLSSSLLEQRLPEQRLSEIQGLESLVHNNVCVGYQRGSFVEDYLKRLGIEKGRLKPLASETEFANALRLGPKNGVAAIVDELPYVQNFLASTCDFTTAGNQIAYFGGFGFAFRKNSQYTREVSMAILSLAQKGTLRRIHDQWLGRRIRK